MVVLIAGSFSFHVCESRLPRVQAWPRYLFRSCVVAVSYTQCVRLRCDVKVAKVRASLDQNWQIQWVCSGKQD